MEAKMDEAEEDEDIGFGLFGDDAPAPKPIVAAAAPRDMPAPSTQPAAPYALGGRAYGGLAAGPGAAAPPPKPYQVSVPVARVPAVPAAPAPAPARAPAPAPPAEPRARASVSSYAANDQLDDLLNSLDSSPAPAPAPPAELRERASKKEKSYAAEDHLDDLLSSIAEAPKKSMKSSGMLIGDLDALMTRTERSPGTLFIFMQLKSRDLSLTPLTPSFLFFSFQHQQRHPH